MGLVRVSCLAVVECDGLVEATVEASEARGKESSLHYLPLSVCKPLLQTGQLPCQSLVPSAAILVLNDGSSLEPSAHDVVDAIGDIDS